MSLVFCWQRSGIRLAPDELVALRACFFAGQDGLPARIRRHCRFDFHLPQPCTSLVKWRQGVAPVACRLRPLRTGQLHLHQLPRLGKGGRRDFGANSGRGAESRRRSGLGLRWFSGLLYGGKQGPYPRDPEVYVPGTGGATSIWISSAGDYRWEAVGT